MPPGTNSGLGVQVAEAAVDRHLRPQGDVPGHHLADGAARSLADRRRARRLPAHPRVVRIGEPRTRNAPPLVIRPQARLRRRASSPTGTTRRHPNTSRRYASSTTSRWTSATSRRGSGAPAPTPTSTASPCCTSATANVGSRCVPAPKRPRRDVERAARLDRRRTGRRHGHVQHRRHADALERRSTPVDAAPRADAAARRVRRRPARARYSIAYFAQADRDAVIESPSGAHAPITAADYLQQRIAANFAG